MNLNYPYESGVRSRLYAWYVVGVLMLAYIFSFIDRQILTLMVEPLKNDLGISDTQLSLLHGFAFAIFYTLVGLPIGRLVDSVNRKYIVTAGVTLWSLMTAACGLAQNFWSLFIFRMSVGVGEATLSPAAYSVISDYFPKYVRGRALAFYTLGISIGIGVALMVGGLVVESATKLGDIVLPFVGSVKAWQLVFMMVGLPGVLVALLTLTIREPVRQDRLHGEQTSTAVPLVLVFTFVKQRRQVYGFLFAGTSMVIIANYAVLAWTPTLFIRSHHWNIAQIGLWFGIVNIVFGSMGGFFGGWLTDRLFRAGYSDAPLRTMLFGALTALPFALLAPLLSSPLWSLISLSGATFFLFIQTGVAPVALQNITPNQMRGQLSALMLFVQNLLGLACGATSVALITDYVFDDGQMLGYSMSIVVTIALPLAAMFMYGGRRYYRAGIENALAWESN